MKTFAAALGLITLAACAGTTAGPLDQIVGKRLVSGPDFFVANADGTMTGPFGGEPLAGVWRNDNGLFCRSGTLGTTAIPEACQTVTITGQTVSLTHTSGGQQTTTYTFADS